MSQHLQTFAILQWTLSLIFLGFVSAIIYIALFFSPFAILPALYAAWYVYDFHTPERGGRRVRWIQNWKIWEHLRDYFPIRLIKTVDLDPSKNYIFVYHPHGILSYGAFLTFATAAGGFEKTFPGLRTDLLVLKLQFMIPFSRDYGMALGSCACTWKSIEWLLTKEGTGNAAVLVVGGASEALEARPGSFSLALMNRKGFAHLALKHGVALVPVFAFGENDVFDQLPNPRGSLVRRFQTLMMKICSFSPPAFYGQGFFNGTFGLLPYRRPINVVVGSPLEVTSVSDPTKEQVDELHGRYIKHLTDLFDSNKASYGIDESQHLNII